MQDGRDPVERAVDDSRDLYGIATWEPRTSFDRLVALVYGYIRPFFRLLLVGVALLLFSGLLVGGLASDLADPDIRLFIGLSVVPALLLALYVWKADVTTGEPLDLLVVTFVLGVLFASFAAIVNSLALTVLTGTASSEFATPGMEILFFFLVVGPAEEGFKLLGARLYAYRDDRFDAVVDGAVYGAVAGLGFATIENAIYISPAVGPAVGDVPVAATAAVRALAGPGHVIYSGIAGYYLGLAKFNREYAGPLVVKGIAIAAIAHGAYNATISTVPETLATEIAWLSPSAAFIGYLILFDGVVGYYLYRLIKRYGRAYHDLEAGGAREEDLSPDVTEFERGVE